MTTIADECILMGAPRIIKKNGGYLANIIRRIADNYDSSDFDGVACLADIQLAKDNCRAIIEAAELTLSSLDNLRNEVVTGKPKIRNFAFWLPICHQKLFLASLVL